MLASWKKYRFVSLLSLLSTPMLFAMEIPKPIESYDLGFDIQRDGLCFQNGGEEIRKYGPKIFGPIGARKGICDGMSLLVGALFMNAEFEPNQARPESTRAVRRLLRKVSRNYIFERDKKIVIPGFSNARDLCNSKINPVVDRAVWLNLRNSIGEALPLVPQFLVRNTKDIGDNLRLRRQFNTTLNRFVGRLKKGKPSMLMYYPHVVLVVGADKYNNEADGRSRWSFKLYDSNSPDRVARLNVPIEADGLPSGKQMMLWDVTP